MTAAAKIQHLPNWPARMGEDMAALYLSVGTTTLRDGWPKGRYPAPVRDGGRIYWYRRQLDQWLDEQFGFGAPVSSWDD